jgi:hypothetical protein
MAARFSEWRKMLQHSASDEHSDITSNPPYSISPYSPVNRYSGRGDTTSRTHRRCRERQIIVTHRVSDSGETIRRADYRLTNSPVEQSVSRLPYIIYVFGFCLTVAGQPELIPARRKARSTRYCKGSSGDPFTIGTHEQRRRRRPGGQSPGGGGALPRRGREPDGLVVDVRQRAVLLVAPGAPTTPFGKCLVLGLVASMSSSPGHGVAAVTAGSNWHAPIFHAVRRLRSSL